MSMSPDGRTNWTGGILGTVIGAALGFLSQSYFSVSHDSRDREQTVDSRMHQEDIEIDALKITTTAIGVEVKGTEASIAQILAAQNANGATLQVLKDAIDGLREQNTSLTTKLDGLNDILRPPRTFPAR